MELKRQIKKEREREREKVKKEEGRQEGEKARPVTPSPSFLPVPSLDLLWELSHLTSL